MAAERVTTLAERVGLLCLGTVLWLALTGADAHAYQLEGTADFDVLFEDAEVGGYTIVTLAGFEVVERGENLVLFAEYGPAHAVAGRAERAGQLYVEVPLAQLGTYGVPRRLEVTSPGLTLRYEEWASGGRTLFSGSGEAGWIEIHYHFRRDELLLVDAVFDVRVLDPERDDTRVLDGVLFGGDVPLRPQPAVQPGSRAVVRRVDHGCGSSGDVLVVEDAYSGSSATYDDDDSGCAGDDYDDGGGGSRYDDDSGCAGDDYDDEDESSSESDDGCDGDDAAASAAGALRPLLRNRRPVEWLARHIHLMLPLVFWAFARRRHRDEQRTATARTPPPGGSRSGCRA
jgi:hypothetical protein